MRLTIFCVLAALALPAPLPADAPAKKRPNVLFLFTDDQRADTIHALGDPLIQTPNLDRLAESGFVFRNAYCMGSTVPAVSSASSRTTLIRCPTRIRPFHSRPTAIRPTYSLAVRLVTRSWSG